MIEESGLLWILAFLFFGQYVIYPFTFFFSHRSKMPELVPVDPEAETADLESVRLIAETSERLSMRGFELAGHFTYSWQSALTSRVTLLVNERESDRAVLVSMRGPGLLNRFMEVTSTFEDGTELSTTNSTVAPGTFAPLPGTRSFQFPDVTDPLEFYGLHRAAIAKYYSTAEKRKVGKLAAKREFTEAYRRVFEHQVEQGLLRPSSRPDSYSATLRGAFLMVWRNAIPVGAIRRFLMRRKMRRALKVLTEQEPAS